MYMAKKELTTKNNEKEVIASYIVAPRLTEKASLQSSANAYTFIVKANATKHGIAREIKASYKVSPVAVNIVNIPGKRVFVRGRFGTTSPMKKAIVFLKKGDTIAIA